MTAVVSVADDGGSSGRLRELLDVVPPGDLRKCLVALAGRGLGRWPWPSSTASRRGSWPGTPSATSILAGLIEATGDLVAGLRRGGRSCSGADGDVLPATVEPVVLKADVADGEVAGQVAVIGGRRHPRRCPSSRRMPDRPGWPSSAIEAADQIVIGPGSLFTSVLAAAAVPGIAEALARCRGQRVYVCNLRPQMPETAGFDVADHVDALARHGVPVDVVLCDTSLGLPRGRVAIDLVDVPAHRRPTRLVHGPGRLALALCQSAVHRRPERKLGAG